MLQLAVGYEDVGKDGSTVLLLNAQQLNSLAAAFGCQTLKCQFSVWDRQELQLKAQASLHTNLLLSLPCLFSQRLQGSELCAQSGPMSRAV